MKTIFKLVACLFLFVSLQSHSVEAGFPFSENDTVTIGDKIWIQPDLFLGVTPAELAAALPVVLMLAVLRLCWRHFNA